MARTNYCRNPAKEKMEERCKYITSVIDGEMSRYGLSDADMAERTAIPLRTFSDRKRSPDMIRMKDLYKIMDELGVRISFERKPQPY